MSSCQGGAPGFGANHCSIYLDFRRIPPFRPMHLLLPLLCILSITIPRARADGGLIERFIDDVDPAVTYTGPIVRCNTTTVCRPHNAPNDGPAFTSTITVDPFVVVFTGAFPKFFFNSTPFLCYSAADGL
jgi:hypothetical protein